MNEKQIELKRQRNLRKQLKSRAKQDKYEQYRTFEKEFTKLIKYYHNKICALNKTQIEIDLFRYEDKKTNKINYIIKKIKTLNRLKNDNLFLHLLKNDKLLYKGYFNIFATENYLNYCLSLFKNHYRSKKYKNIIKLYNKKNDLYLSDEEIIKEHIINKLIKRQEKQLKSILQTTTENKKRGRL